MTDYGNPPTSHMDSYKLNDHEWKYIYQTIIHGTAMSWSDYLYEKGIFSKNPWDFINENKRECNATELAELVFCYRKLLEVLGISDFCTITGKSWSEAVNIMQKLHKIHCELAKNTAPQEDRSPQSNTYEYYYNNCRYNPIHTDKYLMDIADFELAQRIVINAISITDIQELAHWELSSQELYSLFSIERAQIITDQERTYSTHRLENVVYAMHKSLMRLAEWQWNTITDPDWSNNLQILAKLEHQLEYMKHHFPITDILQEEHDHLVEYDPHMMTEYLLGADDFTLMRNVIYETIFSTTDQEILSWGITKNELMALFRITKRKIDQERTYSIKQLENIIYFFQKSLEALTNNDSELLTEPIWGDSLNLFAQLNCQLDYMKQMQAQM